MLLLLPLSAVAAPVEHDIHLRFDLDEARIEVVNTLTVADTGRCFTLRAGLQPHLDNQPLPVHAAGGGHERFCLPDRDEPYTLHYAGSLQHPVIPPADRAADRGSPPISAHGIYLDPTAGWYPDFDGALLSVRLEVQLPAGWRSVSQGRRVERHDDAGGTVEIWEEPNPQTGLFLIATEFHEYAETTGEVDLLALLRADDPALAARYLGVTADYLDLYSALIGPYPYAKFAVVENFWETGYGMPSFTLLGPRVLRLPFILHSSYPHEILHSWWGNAVYVDYASGNWSEGLTTYLADYLLQEQRGRGREFRRNALQRYRNSVNPEQAFPLSGFTARRDALSQSVGYDKGMMLFHDLRRRLGDEAFIDGLRHVYATRKFRRAGFDDLHHSFEVVSGEDLAAEFRQWVERPDLPVLQLSGVAAESGTDGWQLQLTLIQNDPPYALRVPLAIQLAGRDDAWQTTVELSATEQRYTLALPGQPERLAVDPEFDLPRRLAPTETAPVLSQLLGSESLLIVLPADAADHYRRFAARTRGEIVVDSEIDALPTDADIWVVGWNNRWRDAVLDALVEQAVQHDESRIYLNGTGHAVEDTALMLLARHPEAPERALGLLAGSDPDGFTAMAGKLRHYGRYSYLAFTGADADNIAQGQWPVRDSPLDVALEPEAPPWTARLQARDPLWPRRHD